MDSKPYSERVVGGVEQSELLAVIERADQDGSPELNLADQGIDHLPPEIGNLSHLCELDLQDNSLQTLPVEIGNLRSPKASIYAPTKV